MVHVRRHPCRAAQGVRRHEVRRLSGAFLPSYGQRAYRRWRARERAAGRSDRRSGPGCNPLLRRDGRRSGRHGRHRGRGRQGSGRRHEGSREGPRLPCGEGARGRSFPGRCRHGFRGCGSSRTRHAQPYRHAYPARRAASGPRRACLPGRQLCGSRSPSLRLHAFRRGYGRAAGAGRARCQRVHHVRNAHQHLRDLA